MLRWYTRVDDRLLKLGHVVKLWARNNGLNDASMGTVSSYAWIMMLIHFLQRTTPPVLPYLQQVCDFAHSLYERFVVTMHS